MPTEQDLPALTISLNGDDWQYKDFYGEDWNYRHSMLPNTSDVRWWRAASVPGSVLHDLWQAGEVPDPYFEQNSLACEWVSQRSWLYRKRFVVPQELAGRRIQLRCEGVDYSAHFFLNGQLLGSRASMYTQAVFDVSEQLAYGAENWLAIAIDAAPQEQPQIGYSSRVRTHKGRMGYWWDFCPRMVHQGIWDDVLLAISGSVRIDDAFVRPVLAPDHRSASLQIELALDAAAAVEAGVQVEITRQGQPAAALRANHALTAGQTTLRMQVELPDPRLWWPNGYGDQPIYQASITITTGSEISHHRAVTFGVRSIEFAPNENASPDALPYTLLVNGRRIYMKGWNWVPIDALYGVPRHEKRAHLLALAQQAHVNLLRVWGGGLIETEAFYDQCDRLGILVWQEFILSSSGLDNRPSDAAEYIDLLTREAGQIIPRRRNHPSLALWCGGNELQAAAEQPLDDRYPTLAALKTVVHRLDPGRAWLATSPTGPLFSNSLENITERPADLHDVHGPWEYQGETAQYALYNQGTCLLHSEFGVEGITNPRTLDAVIAPQHQWPVSLDSNRYWWHRGAWWVRRKIWDAIFGDLPDVAAYIRATQFTQFDGLRYALEADRRRKYHNSGTLPWQFNEPFPMAACTSAVDYYGRPKPAYYAVKAAYAPVHLSATYPSLAWAAGDPFDTTVWIHNSGLSAIADARLTIQLVGTGGEVYASQQQPVSCGPDCAAQAATFHAALDRAGTVFFLDLALSDAAGQHLAANRYCFTRRLDAQPPLRELWSLPDTTLSVQAQPAHDQTAITVTNTGSSTAMSVWLEDTLPLETGGFVYFSENYFCLFPGETRTVQAAWQGVDPDARRLTVQAWNVTHREIA